MAFTEKYMNAAASGANDGSSEANGWQTMAAAITGVGAGPASASTRINVKAGTYAQTSNTRTFNTAGAATAPVWWRGYNNTIGDLDNVNTGVAGTTMPAWTFTTGQMIVSGADQIFSNIDINSACVTAGGAIKVTGAHVLFYGCRSQNTAANANATAWEISAGPGHAVRCYFKATTTATKCVLLGTAFSHIYGCTVTGGITGVLGGGVTNILMHRCVVDSPVTDAIKISTDTMAVIECSIYAGSANGNGINITSTGSLVAINNYFEGFTTAAKAAINNSSGTNTVNIIAIGNSYFNNTALTAGFGDFPLIFDAGTLGSTGFVAAASQNFSPTAVLYNLGFPGLFENVSLYQGFLTSGAIQPGGSGVPGNIMKVSGQHILAG